MSTPGILYVTMQPEPGLTLAQFHEWYNNEHGPTRLRIPQIFSNGLRYQFNDNDQPAFAAVYDVTCMSHLTTETYTCLRANRSPREAKTIAHVDVKRYFYDMVYTKQSPSFAPIETLTDTEVQGLVSIAAKVTLKDTKDAVGDYQKWFIEEHAEMLSKVPGWLRSRLFKTSHLEDSQKTFMFALHDYTKENGLSGDIHNACLETARWAEIHEKCVASMGQRSGSLFHVFAPAPRDLHSLSRLPVEASFASVDSQTSTMAGPDATIASFLTLPDSLHVPYRLEGNPAVDAPVVAFCNSLLTSLHMWDPLVEIVKKTRPDLKLLRYDTRGRHSIPQPPVAATLEKVTDDLAAVLDALRIDKLHALVGVSMGGATTLNFALRHPDRLERFVACDFNVSSSPANSQAWKDRIAMAEEDGGLGIKKLAELTVSRWFNPKTMERPDVASWMSEMVAENSVEGFKYGCTALWDYDLKPKMADCRVPGLLAVGETDGNGALVKAMSNFSGSLGKDGVDLVIIHQSGHLPMCEQPEAFWNAVKDFV